jgi:lipopolysaccharide transport system permease protein
MTPTRKTPPSSGQTTESKVIVIRPGRGWRGIDWRELREYRELLYFLTWRDIQVRYKQTAIGVAWAVLQPLLTMLVFTLFFGHLGKIPSDGVPYAMFALTGLVPWSFFSNGLTQIANSVVDNAQLITRVYFPRLIVPLASVLSRLIDFALAFLVLMGFLLIFEISLTAKVFLLPLFVLLALIVALGIGLWFSALNVQFRDVKYVVPFLTQLWLFLTPVVYPSSMLPASWRAVYAINPMVGVIEGFRWSLLDVDTAPGAMIFVSTVAALAVLASGLYYFRRVERGFADIV